MIDFSKFDVTKISSFYGGEGEISCRTFLDENARILTSIIPPHSSIGLHKHVDNSEIVYIISGELKCIIDGKEEIVKEGQCHYCPKGHAHEIHNISNVECKTFNVVM